MENDMDIQGTPPQAKTVNKVRLLRGSMVWVYITF